MADELRITTQYTRADFREAARRLMLRRLPRFGVLVFAVSVFFAFLTKSNSTWAEAIGFFVTLILIEVVFVGALMLWWAPRQSARRTDRLNPGIFDRPSTLMLSADGLVVETANSSVQRDWSLVPAYVETANLYGLLTGANAALYMLPKRDVPADFDVPAALAQWGVAPARRFAWRVF
jgi:hypothetical protein